jgi:hypothetical protein
VVTPVLWRRFETSAKEGTNVDRAGEFLVERILENDVQLAPRAENTVSLDAAAAAPQSEKKGCCS